MAGRGGVGKKARLWTTRRGQSTATGEAMTYHTSRGAVATTADRSEVKYRCKLATPGSTRAAEAEPLLVAAPSAEEPLLLEEVSPALADFVADFVADFGAAPPDDDEVD